jgi:Integrase core domain
VHSIVDDCSRLAYSEIDDDETAPTVTAFTRRAPDFFLDHGIVAERLMTDNAFAYIHNRSLRELLHQRDRPPPHAALHAAHQRQGRALRGCPRPRRTLSGGPSGHVRGLLAAFWVLEVHPGQEEPP